MKNYPDSDIYDQMEMLIESSYSDGWVMTGKDEEEVMNYLFQKLDEYGEAVKKKSEETRQEIVDTLTAAKESIIARTEEVNRLTEKWENLKTAAENGDLTEGNVEWLNTYTRYLGKYRTYIEETGDLSVKYEDLVDSILASEKKMREYYGEDGPDELKGLYSKSMSELIKDFQKNGTVMYDMSKDIATDVTSGFSKGIGNEPEKIANEFYKSFDAAIRSDDNFNINSPSVWAMKIMEFIMEGFVEQMEKSLPLFDKPLSLLKEKILYAFADIVVSVQALLNSNPLELRVIPVIDMDNLEYIIGGMRFDKYGNTLGSASYDLSKTLGTSGKSGATDNSGNLLQQLIGKVEELNGGISDLGNNPVEIEIKNEVGVETIINKLNKDSKMNGYKSRLKFVKTT